MQRIEFKLGKLAILMTSTGIFSFPAHAEDMPNTVLDTVVVSAPLREKVSQSARPVTVLTEEQINTGASNTIGATLEKEPGMNNQSFGPGVGAPVIRGQTGPRVRVLQNGIGINDASTLSPDHANGVEPMQAERIEILRGPATLLYGSGAIGGVVNVIDNRIPQEQFDKVFGGAFEQRYNSVSSENASSLKLEGGKGPVAVHLDGFYREQGNMHIGGAAIDETAARANDPALADVYPIQNSYGVINNTNARASGGSAGVSWVGDAGFLGAAVNQLDNHYGIPPDGTGGPNVRVDLTQTRYDLKGEWKNPIAFAEALRLKFGYTDYQHQEIEGGVVGTTWLNQTYETRLEMPHKPLGPVRGVVGFQSINSDFQAFGAEAVVPKSLIDSYGLFAVETFDYGPVTYELGARVEHQSISPENLAKRNFLPVSGAASALFHINDQHQLSFAFTQSQRAPAVQELYTNGVHHATRSFEIGNPNLTKEISYNLDLGYRFKTSWLQAEAHLFQNWVDNYIYAYQTGETYSDPDHVEGETPEEHEHHHGDGLPIMLVRQGNATFKGFESKLVFPLMENRYGLVDLALFSDYTRGEFVHGGDVPRMPPLRYGFQLDYNRNEWSANLRLTRAEAQDNPGDNQSTTPGYVLLGVGAKYQAKVYQGAELTVFARGTNLLNENVRNSVSYLRNFAPEPGRGAELGIRMSY